MMLAITVEFLRGLYHAAGPDDLGLSAGDAHPEWPPSPARLFSALVAGGGTRDNCSDPHGTTALEWLERLPAPVIQAAASEELLFNPITPRFAVVDETAKGRYVQNYPLRKAQEVSDGVRVSLRHPTVTYLWAEADPGAELLDSLRFRASRVPYLGRSDSTVRVSVSGGGGGNGEPATSDGLPVWAPDGQGSVFLPVPHEGLLDKLENAFDTFSSGAPFKRAWIANKLCPYGLPSGEENHPGELGTTIWLRFGRGITGHKVRYVAEALKGLVLSRFGQVTSGEEVPPVLHGHWPPGMTGYHNARWLPLPHAGYPHADGRIRGACVWLPPGTETSVVETVTQILAGTDRLYHGRVFEVPVSLFDGAWYPWTSNPARWTRPSRRWASVFPAVHERYSKGPLTISDVAGWCTNAGYPAPIAFRSATTPLIEGAADLAPIQVFGPNRQPRPYSHLEVVFPREVKGPVALGRGRGYGFGLMAPIQDPTSEEAQ